MAAFSRLFWKLFYHRWPPRETAPIPGYSLLVPVPGDLPVFLKLALSVLRNQDKTHRIETLVIPDVATERVCQIVQQEQASWPGDMRLVNLPWPDRWIPKHLNRPHHNHWLQLINGVRHSRATHALLHDADLFLTELDFLKKQFEKCLAGNYACFGVHRVWDPWFEKRGKNLTATWEMIFETQWARTFAPHLHLGHDDTLNGEQHTFDTALFPQCLTSAHRIGWQEPDQDLIHFNYVICSYRYYRDHPEGYEDSQFRLLLIRLLIDLFDGDTDEYDLPDAATLHRGITDQASSVTYLATETQDNYAEFRGKLDRLFESGLLGNKQIEIAQSIIAPFDRQFISSTRRRPTSP